MVVMLAPSLRLANGCMAGKTMDDRASVAAMLVAAELLSQRSVPAETYFVSTTQEEIGSVGAKSATFRLKPTSPSSSTSPTAKAPAPASGRPIP